MSDQNQHNIEIQLNLQKWREKPLLRRVYQQFYKLILAEIDLKAQGSIVELGSGIGNLKSVLPEALCTDLFANPWNNDIPRAISSASILRLIFMVASRWSRRARAFSRKLAWSWRWRVL